MEKGLKNELRRFGLLPIEIDEETQELYRAAGLDYSRLEKHYTPGMSEERIRQFQAIETNVEFLCNLERVGCTNSRGYEKVEQALREQLKEISTPIISYGRGFPAVTGVCGINRDMFASGR